MRAMNLVDGFTSTPKIEDGKLSSTDNPYALATKKEIKDQFMVGDNLLIAPLFTGETKRQVILPLGKWYDFYTGKLAGEGQVIEISQGPDNIPIFVRDGGIIPMISNSKTKGKDNLNVRFYGQKPSKYKLYDDDGETFNYEKGECSWRTIEVKTTKRGELVGSISAADKTKPNSYGNVSFEFMSPQY
jgi:alpha-D-xyloside xylohydrolase